MIFAIFQIHIFGFPGHTTHLLQPLDVGVFGPLKSKFRSLAADLRYRHQSSVVGKIQTPQLWSKAVDRVCTPKLVRDAFAKCGIHPFDPCAIDRKEVVPRQIPRRFKSR